VSWRASAAGGRRSGRVKVLALIGALLLLPLATVAAQQKLFIYNWADFIGKDTLSDFQKATGIKVVYDTFDAEETKETKLMAGGSGYDVVVSANEYYSREIKAGVYLPLDRARLPHWDNLDPQALADQASSDPGNRYALPYLHAINGFAYNVDEIRARMPGAPVDSLDMIFKPEIVRRFADCGVSLLDSPEDMLQLALVYLGRNPNTTDAADYKAAEQLLMTVRPYVRSFDSSEYLNALANGELCIAVSWSSDYAVSMARAPRGRPVDQSRLQRAAGGGQSHLLVPDDPGGRAAPGCGLQVPEFHVAATGDRRGHQRHLLRQRQPGGQHLRQSADPRRPDPVPDRGYQAATVQRR